MLISEIRKERLEDIVTRAMLQTGKIPSAGDLAMSLKSAIYEKNLDKPLFDYIPVASNTPIDSQKYNEDVSEINQDIEDALQVLKTYQEQAYNVFNYFNIRKAKLEAEIEEAKQKLRELVLSNQMDIVKGCYVELFNNTKTTDQVNSTAKIDIVNHVATIPYESQRFNVNKNNAKITVSNTTGTGITVKTLSGKPEDFLYEDNNSAWQYQITTPTQVATQTTVIISITKQEVAEMQLARINNISLTIQSIKPTYVKVYGKGDQYNLLYEKESASKETINIPVNSETTTFKIVLSKTEADKVTSDNKSYQYIYAIQNISFNHNKYSDEAVLYSTPIEVPKNSTSFNVIVEDEQPSGSSIEYFVQTQNTNSDIWTQITSSDYEYSLENHVQGFKTFSFNSKEAIENTRNIPEITTNGVKFYSLGSLSEDIIQASAVLYRGIDCWRVDKYVQQRDAQFIPTIEDFDDSRQVTSYVKTELRKSLIDRYPVDASMNISFSCSIYCEDDVSIPIKMNCVPAYSLYVNDTKIYSGSNSANVPVAISLNRGWNTLSVVCYSAIQQNVTVDMFSQDFDAAISKMYGDRDPMRLVSLHDLRYNTHVNNRDTYAFYEDDITKVVMNNFYKDIPYKLEYSQTTIASRISLVLKAEFSQQDGLNTSPAIKSYTVRFL